MKRGQTQRREGSPVETIHRQTTRPLLIAAHFYFFLLILLDAVLIGILFWHIRRGNPAETLLDEISDEGLAIKDMYTTISKFGTFV